MWATVDDLADHLGAPSDARMGSDLSAALDWCQRQRPDLDPFADAGPAVRKAVVIYAGLLYRQRSQPAGFATYADLDTGSVDTHSAMINVYNLLGTRRPVAR